MKNIANVLLFSLSFIGLTCKVKLASARPAWFSVTHMYWPESSACTLVSTSVLAFSKPPRSKTRKVCSPRFDTELFRISRSSPSPKNQRTRALGTEPTRQVMLAFWPGREEESRMSVTIGGVENSMMNSGMISYCVMSERMEQYA